ncbi:hypothetical protein SAMN04489806_0796 [Paramicrobacterium humi]|jgi:hypothetical protein|uniref:Uncharacterized protein n=1 Tax=Paramicrobacterium humi TaxID=640635 RepID=A0A1H4JR44_9MICO|nr:hypothetical protein [Microbacterium humi]SEB48072.1 hypothetical protein SAMN04489806_0796 [Microbacterium humi]
MADKIGTRRIEHKDREFEIVPTGPTAWSVTEVLTGVVYGHLVLINMKGEEGSPVYGAVLPDHATPFIDGTDWEDIVRALANQVDSGIDV